MRTEYFARRPDHVSLAIVAGHLLLVFSPVYAAAALGPSWHTPLFFLLVGLGMNGILNLMHECAHALVFERRLWSERLGRRVVAPLVFANFDAYRERHWDHHRFIGQEGETKDTYLIDIRGRHLVTLVLRSVVMIEAAGRFLGQIRRGPGTAPGASAWLAYLVVFQSLLFAALVLTARLYNPTAGWSGAIGNAAIAYGVVYLYALVSVTVLMASLRAIAEHQSYEARSARSGYASLRNFSCNVVSRVLMGAYGFGEHFTHHRVPGIPYYHLARATRELAEAEPALAPVNGYFGVLSQIIAGHHSTTVDAARPR